MDHPLPHTLSLADEWAGALEPEALAPVAPSGRRYVVLVASVVMQLALGGIYAWSTFAVPLRLAHGLTSAQTQIVFGLTIAMLTVATVFSGRWQEVHGPRLVASVGAVLYGSGYLVAGYSGGAFPRLLVGIGLVGGLGTGLAYMCPLAACIKWFPERKGLITGVSVAGFGAGAIVLSTVARVAFNHGWDVLRFFCWMGPVWGGVVLLAALLLSAPAARAGEDLPRLAPLRELLRHREYQALAVGMYCVSFTGVMVIGNLEPMGRAAGLAPAVATLAISLLAVGNALGRVSWGGVYDRFGRAALPGALLFATLGPLVMLSGGRSQAGYLLAAILTGLAYGSCVVLYAAQVATVWGPHLVGAIYPLIGIFNGLAALTGPAIGGGLFDATGSYAAALGLSAVVAAAGALAVWAWPGGRGRRLTGRG
jgi:OFA family oxalate/formate antiporter-like MFS transporter